MAERCRDCAEDAIGWVEDPYDTISGSPIKHEPVAYCLFCYNKRVVGCMEYLLNLLRDTLRVG